MSTFTWFRPDQAAFFEHVNKGNKKSCFSGELHSRCLLLASTEKMFFTTSSVKIASLEEKRDQNERICHGMRSIFLTGWAK